MSNPTVPASPRHRRVAVTKESKELLQDTEASVESLREALANVLSVVDGAEARALIAESELAQVRASTEERRRAKPRGGRAGHARAYTQDRIEEMRTEAESRAQASALRARGRSHRGRGARATRATGSRNVGRKPEEVVEVDGEGVSTPKPSSESDFAPESKSSI